MINYFTFTVAIILSVIAAYFSIAGLATIFAAAIIPIIIMGSALEAAKVVSVSWLYRHWDTCPAAIKYYLIVAIIILMFITSMGTFGYLSKAHIEQSASLGNNSVELTILEQEIDSERRRIDNAQRALASLDRLVTESNTENAINLRQRQAKERKQLVSEISLANTAIKDLSTKALPLRKESIKQEVEVGPIKYIADLTIGDSSQVNLERAVRWIILLIVSVFDPLAVILLLAANVGFSKKYKQNKLKKIVKSDKIEIDKKSIFTL